MEKPLEKAWVSSQVEWWGRISGNHQGRANSVRQVDGDSNRELPLLAVLGTGLNKGTRVSARASV